MSRTIEAEAKKYLIEQFNNKRYKFEDRKDGDKLGFDLWLVDREKKNPIEIELKATKREYNRKSDIFQDLYFSAKNEVDNFKKRNTKIVRIFLGNTPPKIFLLSKSILKAGAKFKKEYRAKIVGEKNYNDIKEF